ncbi:MAG: hypothetical protein WD077_06055 [Bacteroidia bacterium]
MKKWNEIKEMLKKQNNLILAVCGLLLMVVFIAFAERHGKESTCHKIEVEIANPELRFVSEDMIHSIITDQNFDSPVSRKLSQIELERLEEKLKENAFVRDAQVYTTLHGELRARVEQRQPLLRIWSKSGQGYYIDRNGMKMPLNPKYSARVLLATGHIEEGLGKDDSVRTELVQDLYRLALYLEDHAFYNALTGHVQVDANRELMIIPRVGRHEVLFGSFDDLDEKFGRLSIFYREALPKEGWDTYRMINVKYKDQIIANR